ncbi:hypothetical protein FSARC_9196 [Fusarium sarcochroum]|uniref:2EXR domain-containing protein n=1 Tax=Fusarium sarcochroum TaxID=1208366 RepID=A0A8H4X5K7_9HYPO|nr:hypothetical protein FSARC_9196 [Fusarium sarcochroum]
MSEPKLFNKLPLELKQRVWEFTWPNPKIWTIHDRSRVHQIGGNIFGHSLDHDLVTWLRPQAMVPNRLRRVDVDLVGESYHDKLGPVALRVCRQSRQHTLRSFVPIKDASMTPVGNWINIRSDSLWLEPHWAVFKKLPTGYKTPYRYGSYQHAETWHMVNLLKAYGDQITKFRSAIIKHEAWKKYAVAFQLLFLIGVTRVQIVMEEDSTDSSDELLQHVRYMTGHGSRVVTFEILRFDLTLIAEEKVSGFMLKEWSDTYKPWI